jgi:adenosylcobinamide-GDP ribazoletransferase
MTAPRRHPPPALLHQFGAAWTLLTRLPWPLAGAFELAAVGRGVWAFPLIGAILGTLAGGIYWLAREGGLPALVAAALAIGFLALASGALHEDGLADTADGFGGGRSREEKLAIMRDSRTGAYGVLALVIVTLIRIAALAAVGGAEGFAGLAAAAALSRGVAALPMTLLPPARSEGLGYGAGRAPTLAACVALVVAAGLATAFAAGYGLPWPLLGAAIAATLVVAALVAVLALRHIGGFTGDVLGAVILTGEAAALAAFASR